jgi:hypothetical protein
MKFPYPCCRCGFCCLIETCATGRFRFKVGKDDPCPGLEFNGNEASCIIGQHDPEAIGVGNGCCTKATAFAHGVGFDFAALPIKVKINLAQRRRANVSNLAVFKKRKVGAAT